MTDISVLIAGAGAAGLTLAIDLRRRLEVCEALGAPGRMAAIGAPYPPRRIHEDGGFVDEAIIERQATTPAIPDAEPLMLPQNLTEGALRERLAELGAAPEFGCELIGFEQDEAGVTARLRTASGEESVRARFLVGADGGGSF